MKTCFEEYRTSKFTCIRCKKNDMLPNREGDYVKGFHCQVCGEINYPSAKSKDNIVSVQDLKKLNKNELLKYIAKLQGKES